jgi:hypothetical protein
MIGLVRRCRPPVAALALTVIVVTTSCSRQAAVTNGYRPDVVPGITRARVIELLGKPHDEGPFSLPGVQAQVMTYPFGQVLLRDGKVVAVSVNDDPQFRGPFGVTLGMSEDDVRAALAAHPRHRAGHKESYDAIEKSGDTRTKDLYDTTDHVMIEFTATNANDAMAPFNVAQVTFANEAGLALLDAFTKARVDGLYPDVHVDNFTSDDWQGKR